jgi:hypothetical protein
VTYEDGRDRTGHPISGSDRLTGRPMGRRANHRGETRKSHLVSAGGNSMGVKRSTRRPAGTSKSAGAEGAILYTGYTGPIDPARSAARSRMAVSACTTPTSSSCTKRCRSGRTSTSCRECLEPVGGLARPNSVIISFADLLSKAPVGSSAKISFGEHTRALATTTRCLGMISRVSVGLHNRPAPKMGRPN